MRGYLLLSRSERSTRMYRELGISLTFDTQTEDIREAISKVTWVFRPRFICSDLCSV
jgi:hypothetical protein